MMSLVIKLKIKYLRLSKDERKQKKKEYFNTEKGKYVKTKIQNSLICAIICIIFSIYIIIDNILNKMTFLNMFYGISILIIGIILIIAGHIIKIKKINNYVVKNKK